MGCSPNQSLRGRRIIKSMTRYTKSNALLLLSNRLEKDFLFLPHQISHRQTDEWEVEGKAFWNLSAFEDFWKRKGD